MAGLAAAEPDGALLPLATEAVTEGVGLADGPIEHAEIRNAIPIRSALPLEHRGVMRSSSHQR
jgi:hypothetical protein